SPLPPAAVSGEHVRRDRGRRTPARAWPPADARPRRLGTGPARRPSVRAAPTVPLAWLRGARPGVRSRRSAAGRRARAPGRPRPRAPAAARARRAPPRRVLELEPVGVDGLE